MRFNEYYFKEMDDYDASMHYISRYDEILVELMRDVSQAKPTDKQYWKPLPLNRVRKIWSDYMTLGVVRDERGLQAITEDIINKIITLDVNTMLMGHTSQSPEDILNDMEIEYTQEDMEMLETYLTDENGAWRISDYAMDKLRQLANDILQSDKAEEKLLLIDQILNIVHQRSDLAKWFVQGGRSALDQLSGN
jgi:hypothetical protein